MIPASRFIAQSADYETWLEARRGGVTATEVATASTDAGWAQIVADIEDPTPIEPNNYMRFGSEAERDIMRHAHESEGILPSDWLLAGDNPRHLATPDGLSVDHSAIAEAKTTGTDWATPPMKYRRQIQWQLHVSGAERCLLLWNLRVEDDHGWFYLGWLQPKTLWIERNPKMISELVSTADRLLSLKGA